MTERSVKDMRLILINKEKNKIIFGINKNHISLTPYTTKVKITFNDRKIRTMFSIFAR